MWNIGSGVVMAAEEDLTQTSTRRGVNLLDRSVRVGSSPTLSTGRILYLFLVFIIKDKCQEKNMIITTFIKQQIY